MEKIKTIGLYLGILFSLLVILISCGSDDNKPNPQSSDGIVPPTAQKFKMLKDKAIENRTQKFDFFVDDAGMGQGNYTSAKGVDITVMTLPPGFTLNGNLVDGNFKFEFTELYSKADLLLTGFGTVGKHTNGDLEMLVTGGAFRTIVTKDDQVLEGNFQLNLTVPTSLTGGVDYGMIAWSGGFDEQDNLVWEEAPIPNMDNETSGVVQVTEDRYHVFGQGLSHINIDRFWDDPSPRTSISVDVPQGYDKSNSGVFVSFDDVLGILWTYYDVEVGANFKTEGLPIGVTTNIVFVSESNGKWVYAIKSFTITENGTIQILESDLQTATEEELVTVINALP